MNMLKINNKIRLSVLNHFARKIILSWHTSSRSFFELVDFEVELF